MASGEAQAGEGFDVLSAHFEKHYWALFDDASRHIEGLEMLEKWYKRTDWTDVRVISTEKKQNIQVPVTVDGQEVQITFNFIIDRLDEMGDGTIRVVDYKSNVVPFTHDEMRSKPQPRLYGMVAKLMFPKAPSIWVMFDFLRWDGFGVFMDDAMHREAWEWLKGKAQAIVDSDGTLETPNPDCGYCPRAHSCGAIRALADGGSVTGLTVNDDLDVLFDSYVQMQGASKAFDAMLTELRDIITSRMQYEGVSELESDRFTANLSSQRRRSVDPQQAAAVAGADVFARYGTITLKNFEAMIAAEQFDPEQATALRNLIQQRHTGATVKVKPKGPVSGD